MIARHLRKELNHMKKIALWFTPERRQAVQLFAASLAPLFILFGFGSEGSWEQWLILVGAALQFFSNLLSLVNLRVGEWSKAWAVMRGSIYTLGAVAAPALVALGYWSTETSNLVLVGLSLALAAIGNLVSVFTSKQQELEDILVRQLEEVTGE